MTTNTKKKPSAQVLRVAQELSFARALAGNDPSLRNRALKRLKKWFSSMPADKENFDNASFTRLWKGLYYCVWMSDKPLIQEECVDRISSLVHSFKNFQDARKFISNFFHCLSQAWSNLDAHRLDKFLMLVRRFLRQIFELLYQKNWDMSNVKDITEDLTSAFSTTPLGLNTHITEIFMEELAKVGRGKLSPSVLFEFIKPFGEMLRRSDDLRYIQCVVENIFFYLLRQTDEALKHEAKFQAWKQTGFPEGDIDVMEEVVDDQEEEEEDDDENDQDIMEEDSDEEQDEPFDPRAGKVDVFLPPLKFDTAEIVDYLTTLRSDPTMKTQSRKQIGIIISKYQTFLTGKYPLGIHKVEKIEPEDEDEIIEKAAKKLASIDNKLFVKSDINGIKAKTKTLSLLKSRNKIKKRKASVWETTPLQISETTESTSPCTTYGWIVEDKDDKKGNVGINGSGLSSNGFYETTISNNEDCGSKPSPNKKKRKSVETNDSCWGNSAWESTANEVEVPLTPVNHSLLPNVGNASSSLLNGSMGTPGSSKKVEFVLNKNTAQEEKEYKQSVKKRPSIPFDALRKPIQGVLKTTPSHGSANRINHLSPTGLAKLS